MMANFYDPLSVAVRLRDEIAAPSDQPMDLEPALARHFPVACLRIPNLTVASMRERLAAHRVTQPDSLLLCRDRRLRGAAIAWRGHGLLFVDANDPADEQRFTLAHETAHFLSDHEYPRQDLLAQFGPELEEMLDGRRNPTIAERASAVLSHVSLSLLTHLLERDDHQADVERAESDADAFACEILAPHAALGLLCPSPPANEAGVEQVRDLLISEYRLPARPALAHARGYVAAYGVEQSRMSRLGFFPARSWTA